MAERSIKRAERREISHNQALGRWGEDLAAAYIISQGYAILERNYHTSYGELDIVAVHQDQIVFVEVKTRSNSSLGFPEDALTPAKVAHLMHAAHAYLEKYPESPPDWKIEVVAVIGNPGKYQIELFDEVSYGE